MGSRGRKFHEWFRIESILEKIRELSPDLLQGEYPEAFSRELATYWQYGKPFILNPHTYVVRVGREDVPKELQDGFGVHYGAVVTPSRVYMAGSPESLDELLEGKLLEARDGTGEFARGSIS